MKCMRVSSLLLAAGGLVLVSGCVVYPDGRMRLAAPVVYAPPPPVVYAPPPPPPPVVYETPPPVVVEEPVMVPDSYAWDGYEYVGVVGGQYFYLGAGNVWLVAEPFRLERFHGWERGHPDWREHAIRNDRFRNDSHGHVQPRHDEGKKRDDRDGHH
ncbi:MAG TPA: hypothetical protein VK815_01230 [Candidatus Acidoferrales bacterium]|nr:hypothetical protein [Candidatus Acidoferrales bacterium]